MVYLHDNLTLSLVLFLLSPFCSLTRSLSFPLCFLFPLYISLPLYFYSHFPLPHYFPSSSLSLNISSFLFSPPSFSIHYFSAFFPFPLTSPFLISTHSPYYSVFLSSLPLLLSPLSPYLSISHSLSFFLYSYVLFLSLSRALSLPPVLLSIYFVNICITS